MIRPLTLIVLHTQHYKETSLLVHAYTNELGLQTYLLKGIRTPSQKGRVTLFHPMSLLDVQAYDHPKRELQLLKEYHRALALDTLRVDVRKNAIALFMGELLYKCIREVNPDPQLFQYIFNTVVQLERETTSDAHLLFATRLCAYLGYAPTDNYDLQTPYFDIPSARFVTIPSKADAFTLHSSLMLHQLLTYGSLTSPNLSITGTHRSEYLQEIMRYYEHHLGKSLQMQSPDILHLIFAL